MATDDTALENTEDFTIALSGAGSTTGQSISITGTLNSQTTSILDNESPTVTLTANDDAAEAGSDPGQFTVDLGGLNQTGAGITVNYTVAGTASAPGDYAPLSGSVVIADGSQTAVINVAGIVDDNLVEADEVVIVTLQSAAHPSVSVDSTSQSVVILDNDTAEVTVTANDATASEPGNDGQFTVSISNPSATDTVVAYTIGGDATSGDDFTPLSGTVTILAGQTSATIDVAVADDSILEDNESVTLTLDSITAGDADISIGAADSATVTISDDDTATVSISSIDSIASEPGNDGQLRVTLSQPSDSDTVVSYAISGTATAGTDFVALSGTVTVLAGSTTATIDISVLCLLYTSPSPRDLSTSRMPSSA